MKKFILVCRENHQKVSNEIYPSFDDARIARHKMEIENPDLIVDIIELKTNKEHLVEMLRKEANLSSGGVLDLFDIINEYDWSCFCSYMDDYDHPEERIQAKKVLDEKLSHYPERTWKKVWFLLKEDGEIHSFYNDKFHHMDEEYKK